MTMEKFVKGLLGEKPMFRAQNLSEVDSTVKMSFTARSTKDRTIRRLDPTELEYVYLTDSLVKSSITKKTLAFDFYPGVRYGTANPQKVDAFLEANSFSSFKREVFKVAGIYGNAWVERVYDNSERLIGFILLDSKTIDYLRDTQGNIAVDDYGRPKGYVQYIPTDMRSSPQVKGRVISLPGGKFGITLEPHRIVRFYFDSVGDNWNGIGFIEPIYNASLGKAEAEAGFAISINKMGFPIIINKVGDPTHPPSGPMIEEGQRLIKDLNYRKTLAVPYYMDVHTLESAGLKGVGDTFDHLVDQELSGLGIPKSLSMGTGDATNRSTLVTQLKFLFMESRVYRDIFCEQFNELIMLEYARTNQILLPPRVFSKGSALDDTILSVDEDAKGEKGGDIG